MNDSNLPKIVIRHISGSKANQIEEFTLDGRSEIRFGRDPSCDIVYGASRDDVVSRNHAVIGVSTREPLAFTLSDLGSSNGTFLNKHRVEGKSELLPEDTVMFGQNGPSFSFDVEPRPANLSGRTRVIDTTVAATRVVNAAEAATVASTAVELKAGTPSTTITAVQDEPVGPQTGKIGVGRDTMLHEIAKERAATNRTWFAALGGLAAICVIGGGALYFKQMKSAQEELKTLREVRQEAEEQNRDAEAEAAASLKQRLGMSPQDVVRQYGPATAKLDAQWRLYDQITGRPIFQRVWEYQNKKHPLYVKLPNGTIVQWLTLDDENRKNKAISERFSGTAFVVSEQGFLLTNKHLAAAWKLPISDCGCFENIGWLVEKNAAKKNSYKLTEIDLNSNDYRFLKDWVPERGGVIFAGTTLRVAGPGNIPDPSKNEQHNFVGRDELITVTFAGNRLGNNATLVRYSNESDAALIKIDTPEALHKVEIAEDDRPSTGERAIVLGFPAIAAETYAIEDTIENGNFIRNKELVPQPYVTEGIVALVSKRILTKNGVTVAGAEGDIMQLTINATGEGNSGGPVFNSSGKVIGMFTYGFISGTTRSTAAVPIKYGVDLFKAQ